MEDLEIVNLPRISFVEYKIVQMYHNEKPILLCGEMFDYINHFHRKILENYLLEKEIEFETFVNYNSFYLRKLPALSSLDYKVVGMGHWNHYEGKEDFDFPFGSSDDYILKTDSEFNLLLKEMFDNKKIVNF